MSTESVALITGKKPEPKMACMVSESYLVCNNVRFSTVKTFYWVFGGKVA